MSPVICALHAANIVYHEEGGASWYVIYFILFLFFSFENIEVEWKVWQAQRQLGRIVMSAGIPVVMLHEWNGNQMSPCWHSTYRWSLWFSVQHPGKCHRVSAWRRLDISILQLKIQRKTKAKYPRWCLYTTRTDLQWCIAVAFSFFFFAGASFFAADTLKPFLSVFKRVRERSRRFLHIYPSVDLHVAHLEMFKDGSQFVNILFKLERVSAHSEQDELLWGKCSMSQFE